MANALNVHEGKASDAFTPERVLRDAFGPEAAFTVLIAEREGVAVGYASYAMGYNTDIAAPSVWLYDLYVTDQARQLGAGRALMAAVAAETVRRGAHSLEWGVRAANRRARAFYAALGARDEDLRILTLDGGALGALAREGERRVAG